METILDFIYPTTLLISIGWWFYETVRASKQSIYARSLTSSILIELGLALIFTTTIAVLIPGKFRIFADEVNIALTAKSLLSSWTIFYPIEEVTAAGATLLQRSVLSERPLLLPLIGAFVSLFIDNPLAATVLANLIILFGFNFTFLMIAARHYGRTVACSGLMLLFSNQEILLASRSGGFDLIALFFLFTSFITLKKYLNFNSTQNFTLLLSNLVLLAHSRFESFIYSGLILLLLIIFKELPKGRYSSLLSYIIYPALIFPTILQRLLTSGIFELNDGNSKQAFKFFVDNTAVFFNKVISTDQTQYIYPLMFLGLLAALYWTWKDLRADAVSRKFTIIVTITFLVSWYIITSHYWSRIDDPFVSRHYLPFALLFVICLFRLLSISRESIIITPFLLTLFVIELLQAQGLADKPVGIYSERFYVTNDLLKRYSDSEKAEVLIVNNSPKQYILQGFSAITIDSFKKLASQSQLKDFKKILFIDNLHKRQDSPSTTSTDGKLIFEYIYTAIEEPGALKLIVYEQSYQQI